MLTMICLSFPTILALHANYSDSYVELATPREGPPLSLNPPSPSTIPTYLPTFTPSLYSRLPKA